MEIMKGYLSELTGGNLRKKSFHIYPQILLINICKNYNFNCFLQCLRAVEQIAQNLIIRAALTLAVRKLKLPIKIHEAF